VSVQPTNVSRQASVEIVKSEFSALFFLISLLPNKLSPSSILWFDNKP